MTCDTCKTPFTYCFYLNDEYWLKAAGKKEGYLCAHCVLEANGGLDWYIIHNEPGKKMRENANR